MNFSHTRKEKKKDPNHGNIYIEKSVIHLMNFIVYFSHFLYHTCPVPEFLELLRQWGCSLGLKINDWKYCWLIYVREKHCWLAENKRLKAQAYMLKDRWDRERECALCFLGPHISQFKRSIQLWKKTRVMVHLSLCCKSSAPYVCQMFGKLYARVKHLCWSSY
jgi:hypothetical protein